MVSGLKDVTKEELEELYWGQNLTLSQIGDMFSVTYPTVIYWMEKRGVRRKGVRKYKTKVFNGDELEKAYLMGLRLGDLNVRPHRKQILVRTSTSHPSMLKLFRDVFQKYSHVNQFPLFNSTKKPHFDWQIYALLDESFEFMLSETIPSEITADENEFYSFLSGYTDAEGCITISPNGEWIRFRFILGSEDSKILSLIATKLKEMEYNLKLRITAKKGESFGRGHCYTRDYWELRIATKSDVKDLLEQLKLCHPEKNKWKKLILETYEAKKWSQIQEKVVALRGSIKKEVSECVTKAEEKYRSRQAEKEESS